MKITRLGALGMLAVLKPSRILVFVLIWNVLFGLTVLLDGGMHRPIKTVGGNLGFALMGVFAAFSGFAPLFSSAIRQRWCRPEERFEDARTGLILIGSIGSVFAVLSVWAILQKLMGN